MAFEAQLREGEEVVHTSLIYRLAAVSLVAITFFPAFGGRALVAKDCRLATNPTAIGPNDYNCFKEIKDVRISKDGKYGAYVVDSKVYVRPSDGGEPRDPLRSRREASWSPVWSRDGKALYLLSENSDRTEVWQASPTENHEPKRIARLELGVESIKLSPNRSRLLMELTCRPSRRDHLHPPDCAKPEPREDKPLVITNMVFKEDGVGYLAATKKQRIYAFEPANDILIPLSADAGSDITEEKNINHDTEAVWSPAEHGKIAFIREYPSSLEYRSELWIAPSTGVENGDAEQLVSVPKAERRSPSWSGDGKLIAYFWSDAQLGPYAVRQLAVYSIADKREKVLTRGLNRAVTSFRFSPDNRFVYFLYAKEGGQYLSRIRLRDDQGNPTEQAIIEPVMAEGEYFISDFDVGEDGRVAMVIHKERENGPLKVFLPDVYVKKPDQPPKRLTDFNKTFLASHKFAAKERVFIERDGRRLFETFVTKPFGFQANRKYPAILHIHGGPTDDWHTFESDWFAQFLAANGYLVVEPNPPGSLGGTQEQVRKIQYNWGCNDELDILRAIDEVVKRGWADPKQLFVTGYSYGGYMTNCLITRAPETFKAAASGAGHSLIAANFGHDQWLQWYNLELGPPWKNPELYKKLSPLDLIEKVRTPTMFLGGSADWNVPILNLELFYQSLRIRGIDTKLVIYPDASHVNGWDKFGLDYYEQILNWFSCHGGSEARVVECAK